MLIEYFQRSGVRTSSSKQRLNSPMSNSALGLANVRKGSEFKDLARRCRGFDPHRPNSCIRLIWLNLALHLGDFDRDLGSILRPSCAQLFQFGTDAGYRVETQRKTN